MGKSIMSSPMAVEDRVILPTASVEQRVDAIQAALDERGMKASEAVAEFPHLVAEQWVPQKPARERA
jgi:nitrile hydratase